MDYEIVPGIIALIVLLITVGFIGYGISLLLAGTIRDTRDRLALHYQKNVHDNLKKGYEQYLLGKFDYYDKLPEQLRVKFLIRIRAFLAEKTFEGKDNLEITDEKKVLVAASAIQLTFGLSNFVLRHFDHIILYPVSFYSRLNDAWHMGETNARGIIVLSWQDLQEGFNKKEDAFNVGLHEMAHALELQVALREDYDFFFGNYFAKWSHFAEKEFQNLLDERESLFRKYAGVNRHEFFAVSVEYFFEASAAFKERLPLLYYHLCVLLNQDPMHNDASIETRPVKTDEEMRRELETMQPLMATASSSKRVLIFYSLLAVVFGSLLFQGFQSAPSLLYFSLFLGAVLLAGMILRMNQIILYEKYVVVKNVFGKTRNVFDLEDIISLEFSGDGREGSMKAVVARNGKIYKRNFPSFMPSQSLEMLKMRLKEKDVLIR
jgi:Mlc titration factor MtfA (ptsG expression regulator)